MLLCDSELFVQFDSDAFLYSLTDPTPPLEMKKTKHTHTHTQRYKKTGFVLGRGRLGTHCPCLLLCSLCKVGLWQQSPDCHSVTVIISTLARARAHTRRSLTQLQAPMTLCAMLIVEQSSCNTVISSIFCPPPLPPRPSASHSPHLLPLADQLLPVPTGKRDTHTHNLKACWAGSYWLAMGFLEAAGPNPWSQGSAGPLATGRGWDILRSLGCHALRKPLKMLLPTQQIPTALSRLL